MAASEPTTDHQEILDWATRNNAVPTEKLPQIVDGEPGVLRFMIREQAEDHKDIRLISWEEFFLKFDALGLSFVYDKGTSGDNEILQIEERSPYRTRYYRPAVFDS